MTAEVRTAYSERTVDFIRPDPDDPYRPDSPVTMTAEGYATEERRLNHARFEAAFEDEILNCLVNHVGFIV